MKKWIYCFIFCVVSISLFANSTTIHTIKQNISGSSYAVTVSPSQKSVAYVVGDSQFMYGQLYIWKVGEKAPVKILGVEDRICGLTFSPNSKYLLVDSGTSALRTERIISVEKNRNILSFSAVGTAMFSPNSNLVAYGSVSNIKPKMDTEVEGVVNLSLYNLNTLSSKILVKATVESSYEPSKWDGENLYYIWYNLLNGKSEILMINAKN